MFCLVVAILFSSLSFRSQDFVLRSIVVGIVGRIERTIFPHAEQPRCDVCASNAEKRLRENATLYKEKRECDEKHMYARGRDSSFVRPRLVSCRVRTVSFHFHVLTFSAVFLPYFPTKTRLFQTPSVGRAAHPGRAAPVFLTCNAAIRVAIDDEVAFFRRSMTIRRPSGIAGRTRTERSLDTRCVRRSSPVFSRSRIRKPTHTVFTYTRGSASAVYHCVTTITPPLKLSETKRRRTGTAA